MNVDAEEEIRRRSENVSREDIADLLGKESTAERLSAKAGFLSQYWENIKTSFALIRDWFSGTYDKIPGRMVVSLAGALIYFISPLDLVPDWIPLAGYLDDAAILAAVFKLSEADLKNYRAWRRKRSREEALNEVAVEPIRESEGIHA